MLPYLFARIMSSVTAFLASEEALNHLSLALNPQILPWFCRWIHRQSHIDKRHLVLRFNRVQFECILAEGLVILDKY